MDLPEVGSQRHEHKTQLIRCDGAAVSDPGVRVPPRPSRLGRGAWKFLRKTLEIVAMHAGLECGVIGEKHPGMQMISFRLHVVDVHSPGKAEDLVGGVVLEHPEGAA